MKSVQLFFLMLVPLWLMGQSKPIDSLRQVLGSATVDTVRGRTLCRICDQQWRQGQLAESVASAEEGIRILRRVADAEGEASCLRGLGIALANQGNFNEALDCFRQSLAIHEKRGDRRGMASNLNNLGGIYDFLGDYTQALEYFQRSLAIKQELGDPNDIASSLGNIGNVHLNRGNHPRALDCYQQAYRIYEKSGNRLGLASCLTGISNIYEKSGDLARALDYSQRSLRITEALGDPIRSARNLSNIASLHEQAGDLGQALAFFERSQALSTQVGDRGAIADSFYNLANIYRRKGDWDRALELCQSSLKLYQELGMAADMARSLIGIAILKLHLGRLAEAQSYAYRGQGLADDIGFLELKREAADVSYRVDSALGNWQAAFKAHQRFKLYSDSLKNDARSQELGRLESKAEYEKQIEIDRLTSAEQQRRTTERFAWIAGTGTGGLLLLALIAFTLYRARRKEQQANTALRTLNEEIQQQKAEIEAINAELYLTLDEVNQQKSQIEAQHTQIEDSIRYASRIQHAILPSAGQAAELLPPHFIHYQPRDIVSGDFYWLAHTADRTFFAVVDCTGHGVPGAFMSVLGSNLLHQIVEENQIIDPEAILVALDRRISLMLRQQLGGDSKDGMDIALVVLHQLDAQGQRMVEYAGAGRPLWQYIKGQITELKSAKHACGGSQYTDCTFPAHRLVVQPGDRLYLFSDGVTDQFGGPKGRKLGPAGLKAFLTETAAQPIAAQGLAFQHFFHDWMGSRRQLDDVLLAGICF